MPIKAEVTTEDALSINSSNTTMNLNNTSTENTSSPQILTSSVSTIKSSQIPTKINPVKDKSTSNDNKAARFDGGEQQIVVACRLRPLTEDEIIEGSKLIGHKIADDNMIVLMDPSEDQEDVLRVNRSREKQFIFDMVFDPRTTQQDIYEKTTKVLLSGVLNGYNATVFSYGATGAGKTYTMLGTEEEPGIMFRTLHDLFIEISKKDDKMYQVSMSYLEIYNELIRDLLSPSNGFLELREDAKGGVQVAGISELVAETPQEVMYMLHKGNKERTQEPTKANKTSSRSHAVLQVNIKQRKKGKTKHSQEVRLGKLYMIDLAGSERAAHTQNTGKRMVEGAHINRSLLALGNCINALSEKGGTKYVNYRDSKLTRILKDSLGGNSKTVMIAHVSPASIHFEESRNTLVYADRAKYIRTKLRRNVIDVSFHISQYQTIIQELAGEIASLKHQRTDLESRISHLDPRFSNSEDKSRLEEALKLRESLLQSFKHQIGLRKAILELDNAIMDINIEADRNNKIIEGWESQKDSNSKTNGQQNEASSGSITNIREELKVVEKDREDLEIKRKAALKELEASKIKTKRLRDVASKKLNSNEQKEILSLLVKNFEFEIRNIEMQADIFKRDFKLREQDMIILRLEQHRSLCDTLIFQQRQLITDNNIQIPKDLDELYLLYARDVNEGQLMKDLTRIDFKETSPNPQQALNSLSTSSFLAANQMNSSFLSQIQEENGESKSNLPSAKIQDQQGNSFPGLVPESNNSSKMFHPTNKSLPTYNTNANSSLTNNALSKSLKKSQKDANYQNVSSNYFSPNNQNGHNSTIGPPQLAFNYTKDKNNLSMLSSSTVDSKDMEIIIDNTSTNRNLISTTNPRNGKSNILTNSSSLINNIAPPGQVVGTQGFKLNSNSYNSINGIVGGNESNIAKRQTQGIAAKAAQRKAYQHHRELMQEIGIDNNQGSQKDGLTASRLAKHDLNAVDKYDDLFEKKNSVLTDASLNTTSKAKKQVKIRDIVQYKLPDEESVYKSNKPFQQQQQNNSHQQYQNNSNQQYQISSTQQYQIGSTQQYQNSSNQQYQNSSNQQYQNSSNQQYQNNTHHRTNSLSPVLTKRSDDVVYKYAKSKQTNNVKRSKSNNPKNNTKFTSKIPPPSIPSNYSNKSLNMSISGTSVLRN